MIPKATSRVRYTQEHRHVALPSLPEEPTPSVGKQSIDLLLNEVRTAEFMDLHRESSMERANESDAKTQQTSNAEIRTRKPLSE